MTSHDQHHNLVTTARITGVLYLIIAISGLLGFMIFHPQVFVSGDPEKTLSNLIELQSLARTRLFLEFVIIVSQALAAVWFYKLFKGINETAAWAIGSWGIVNSIAIMISAFSMGAAMEMANSAVLGYEEKISLIHLLTNVSSQAWTIGGLFFGLWLIPMGYVVIKSERMPIWLGRTLVIGGVGYLINTFIHYTPLDNSFLDLLIVPATIGEFWMIGYLLIFGIRPIKNAPE